MLRRKGNRGYCPICEREVYFEIKGPYLRAEYKCVNCQSIPRWRALMLVVAELYPKWRELKIHESSPAVRYLPSWRGNARSIFLLISFKMRREAKSAGGFAVKI